MGLSRNKVAVSEGAAGSPPFYGEQEELKKDFSYSQRNKTDDEEQSSSLQLLFDFQGPLEKEKR